MKTKALIILSAVVVLASTSAFAVPIAPVNITMSGSPPFTGSTSVIANNESPSDFGDATVLNWLKADVSAYNATYTASYAIPTAGAGNAPLEKVTTGSGPSSINITLGEYDYIFLHWGGQNGGWAQAFYIGDGTGTYTFESPPGGHPAVGGLSFYSLYGPTQKSVPDGGSTAILLGASLSFLGLVRRRFRFD